MPRYISRHISQYTAANTPRIETKSRHNLDSLFLMKASEYRMDLSTEVKTGRHLYEPNINIYGRTKMNGFYYSSVWRRRSSTFLVILIFSSVFLAFSRSPKIDSENTETDSFHLK